MSGLPHQALEKLGTTCVLKISPTSLYILMAKEFTKGDQGFVELAMSSIFENIILASLNDDVIVLQVNLLHLLGALKSAEGDKVGEITIRLTKKNEQPCLSFEIKRCAVWFSACGGCVCVP